MQATSSHGHYRPEIDGLRAIAVLSVIAYHLGFPGAVSGYAGVDVFFVISGFLIGGIVLRERAEGRFSYTSFYARRVRRILPALCVVMLALLPFAWALMTPHTLRYAGGGVIAALAFVSNIWFYTRIDYFNPDAELDPLLHTWSLGVEEQFYLVFPPLVALLAIIHRRSVLPGLLVLFFASLAAALMTSTERPTLAFYMLHTRMWELLAGVLAAIVLPRASQVGRAGTEFWSVVGLGALLFGVMAMPEPVGWPGLTTLVPVGGTVLVLLFARQGLAFRILSSWPLRGVGLVSYSAYLIHHPLITMSELAGFDISGLSAKIGVIVLTLLLATASWAFVEQPFRRKGALQQGRKVLLAGGLAGLAVFAVAGHVTKGFPGRLPEAAQEMLTYVDSRSPTHAKCTLGRKEGRDLNPDRACRHNPDAAGPEIVIWGDSHVSVLTYQLAQALPESPLREFTLGGCPPIPDVLNILQQTNAPVRRADGCPESNAVLRDYILAHDEIRMVILYAYWVNYTERRDFDTRAGLVMKDKLFSVPRGNDASLEDPERLSFMAKSFATLVQDLRNAGKEVVILYPLPIAGWDLPRYLAKLIWHDGVTPADLSYPKSAFDDYAASARAVLDTASSDQGVHRLDFSELFCSQEKGCTVYAAGKPYFFDTNHMSQPGVSMFAPELANAIRPILARLAP